MDKDEYVMNDRVEVATIKSLIRARELDGAIVVLNNYGAFLEAHPEAFEYLEVTPTNRTFGPLNTSV